MTAGHGNDARRQHLNALLLALEKLIAVAERDAESLIAAKISEAQDVVRYRLEAIKPPPR